MPDARLFRRQILESLKRASLHHYSTFLWFGMHDAAERAMADYERFRAELAEMAYEDVLEPFAW